MAKKLENRYEFVYYFDVTNGNPNGDPDAGNLPRVDAETSLGITTDVSLKRKVRNYVALKYNEKIPYRTYVRERGILNKLHEVAHQFVNGELTGTPDDKIEEVHQAGMRLEKDPNADKKKDKTDRVGKGDVVDKARQFMCQNFYDVRTFGAVMTTGTNAGQVRGPVQFTFSQSEDPIVQNEVSITRMAVTTEEEAKKQQGDNRTMGRKAYVPYGLYRMEGYISANLANQTGFNTEDLELLWEALTNMWDHDHSASRGKMNARKLVVFKHDGKMGNAPAHKLFDLVKCSKKESVDVPRYFEDYTITIDRNLPNGVKLEEKI